MGAFAHSIGRDLPPMAQADAQLYGLLSERTDRTFHRA